MSTITDRYHIIDPALCELVATLPCRRDALREACVYANQRGNAIEVYDSMAHRGRPELWSVDGADRRTTIEVRPS